MPAALPKLKVGQEINGFRILSVSDDGKKCLKQTKYQVKALACGCTVVVGHYGLLNRLPRIQDGICKPCLMVLSHKGIFGHSHHGAQKEILDRMEANGADTSTWARHPVGKVVTPAPAPATSQQSKLMRQWGLA